MNAIHKKFMKRAIDLAVKGAGRTSPNPVVGAVVVKTGRIVGEGYHKRAGDAHAEIVALRKAGLKAKGADLYITLEPCCHYGRTPPCCNAIVKSGVKRVVIGMRDPNPLVNGKGIGALKNRRISITEGVLRKECASINSPYLKWIAGGIPYVTLKVALSLDGKIATKTGDSKWITNESCRRYVHELRDKADAILIGVGTALKDNPRLTVRLPGFPLPSWERVGVRGALHKVAIVLDGKLSLPLTSKLSKRKNGKLIIATTAHASKSKIKRFEKRGRKILLCRSTGDGYVFLPHLLEQLGALGVTSILVEGGGEVFSDFLRRGLADKIVACIAPKLIGGRGRDFLPGIGSDSLKKSLHLRGVIIKMFNGNLVVEGRF